MLSLTLQGPVSETHLVPLSVYFERREDGTWFRHVHYTYHSSSGTARRVPRAVTALAERGATVIKWRRRKATVATIADIYRSDSSKAFCQQLKEKT